MLHPNAGQNITIKCIKKTLKHISFEEAEVVKFFFMVLIFWKSGHLFFRVISLLVTTYKSQGVCNTIEFNSTKKEQKRDKKRD